MPEQASIDAIRAAVDAVLPGDGTLPAASALGLERHVCDLVEQALPGYIDLIAALLNAYAAEASGSEFVSLDEDGRRAVLRSMSKDESQDIRDAVDAIVVFTLGGMYSEWTGFDKEKRVLRAPASWGAVGFHGVSLGYPDFREGF